MDLAPIPARIRRDLLGIDPIVPRPVFDESLGDRLRKELEGSVAEVIGDSLWVGKYPLSQVHRCQGLYAASRDGFAWTVPMIRGRVAHRAIEASIMLGEKAPPAMELVERAVERLAQAEEQPEVAALINNLEPLDRARLISEANDAAQRFIADWPPIPKAWSPRVESPVRVRLCDNRLVLGAKYDLALSQPKGGEARVIIVDFKTGSPHPTHAEDMRFYALVETLRSGIPPFRVASYYLEEGVFQVEDVTEDLLFTAVRRTADGVRAIARLTAGEAPVLNAGSHCRFCPVVRECPAAALHKNDVE